MATDDRVEVLMAAMDAVMAHADATERRQDLTAAEVGQLTAQLANLSSIMAAHANRLTALEQAVANQQDQLNRQATAASLARATQALNATALASSIAAVNSTAVMLGSSLETVKAEAVALSTSLASTANSLSASLAAVNASAATEAASLARAISAVSLTPGPAGVNGSCVRFDSGEPVECPQAGSYAGAADVAALRVTIAAVSRMMWMMEQKTEERVRTEGSSGITRVQNTAVGPRAYHDGTDVSFSTVTMHDHTDFRYLMGVGQLSAAIHGFSFTSRHNDYKMSQNAANKTGNMRSLETIEYPPVPPSVLAKATTEEQILELREYFRAWQASDTSIRDYRPYFKPALCVLEMAWLDASGDLVDPFDSDRHELAAKNWDELRNTVAWMTETGSKDTFENLGFFPASVRGVNADGSPKISNLDYRIFCHKTDAHIPLHQLRPVDTLSSRLSSSVPVTQAKLRNDRRTRFQLNPRTDEQSGWADTPTFWQRIDDLMAEIPGRDGYGSYIEDFEFAAAQKQSHKTYEFNDPEKRLNAANYHRFFKTRVGDATGRQHRRRGFSDMNLFAARTTQSEVTGIPNPMYGRAGVGSEDVEHKWTFAIPLELVYLTPLNNWDPFNIGYETSCATARGSGNTRTGVVGDVARAFNGSCESTFFRTPERFYDSGVNTSSDAADTGRGVKGVLDLDGNLRRTLASGNFIITPSIEGLGPVRLRYPIYSTHWEGSTTWKETKALQALTLEAKVSAQAYVGLSDIRAGFVGVDLITSASTTGNAHTHHIYVTADQVAELEEGRPVTVQSTEDEAHTHSFVILRVQSGGSWVYRVSECDGRTTGCMHGHGTMAVSPVQFQR